MLSKVTMILRGYTYEEVRCVANVLLGSKNIRNMEVTLNTENAFEIIEEISKEFGDQLNVGAGTVLTYEELVKAHKAGAAFVLSPHLMSKEMMDYCTKHSIFSVPGAFTPSEVAQAMSLGANAVKIFPANEVSYSYANKMREPMGDLPLMAVGGVNKTNVKEVLNSGYSFVGSAGGIFSKEDIKNKDTAKLENALEDFEKSLA